MDTTLNEESNMYALAIKRFIDRTVMIAFNNLPFIHQHADTKNEQTEFKPISETMRGAAKANPRL